jgi:hypothetical protein
MAVAEKPGPPVYPLGVPCPHPRGCRIGLTTPSALVTQCGQRIPAPLVGRPWDQTPAYREWLEHDCEETQ